MQGMYAALMSGPHPGWEVLQQHIARNVPEYITFIGALAIAAVCTMPANPPISFRELWSWLRDTLQTAVPAARARHEASSQTTVTTPTTSVTKEATASTAIDPPERPTPPETPAPKE